MVRKPDILQALSQLLPEDYKKCSVVQLRHEEDNAPYDVWRVDAGDTRWILKKAKGYEYDVYTSFLTPPCVQAPLLKGTTIWNGETYLLEAYIDGHNLQKRDRRAV